MKFRYAPNKIIGAENPWLVWIFGGIFISFGIIFLLLWHSGIFGNGFFDSWDDYIATFISLAIITSGCSIIYGGSFTTLTVDAISQKISLKRTRIFDKTFQEFSFAEIERFLLIKRREISESKGELAPISNKKRYSYFLGMKLKNGEQITISHIGSADENVEKIAVNALNEFIGLNRA